MPGQRFLSPEDTVGVFKNKGFEVSTGVEKPTQMMVVHQNIMTTVMIKFVKLSYGNVIFHLGIPEIC